MNEWSNNSYLYSNKLKLVSNFNYSFIRYSKKIDFFYFFVRVFSWIKPGCENMFTSVSLCEQATVNSFLRVFKDLNSLRQLCGKYFLNKFSRKFMKMRVKCWCKRRHKCAINNDKCFFGWIEVYSVQKCIYDSNCHY